MVLKTADYPGFDYTNIIAYRSVCKSCTAGFLLSVSGRRVEASLRYTVSLVGICFRLCFYTCIDISLTCK